MEDKCVPQALPQFKVIVVGDSHVGKTSLLERLHFESFEETTQSTVGAAFLTHDMVIDQQPMKLLMWDTAGQERFRSIAQSYYRSADGALLVFDQSDRRTYESVMSYWRSELSTNCADIAVVVVANKSDRPADVLMDDVQRDCDNYSLPLFETSCKDGEGVDRVFEQLAREIMMRYRQNPNVFTSMAESDSGLNSFMLHQQVEEQEETPYFSCCNVF